MSYTSSDPEQYNRDPDASSLASTSTTASQLSKSNKKPWSKLKSSIKSIGRRMSTGSKPNFAEPTESSERKKSRKNKKVKESSSSTSDVNPSSVDKPREKSPTKGPKNLIKKLSVESLGAPFVGFQPSSVSPSRSYAKAVSKSPGSTSESNLSFSDFDSPSRKASTLDKSTKFSFPTHESPDSGRVSQAMDDSRPPSQVTEEGYVSGTQRDTSDSDYTPKGKSAAKEVPFESLVSKTAQFAQSLIPPKDEKKNNTVASASFITAETVVKNPEPSKKTAKSANASNVETNKENNKIISASQTQEITTDEIGKASNSTKIDRTEKDGKADLNKSSIDEVEGRKKTKQPVTVKKDAASTDFIKSEQSKSSKDETSENLSSEKGTSSMNNTLATATSEEIEGKTKTEPSVDSSKEKSKRITSRGKKSEEKTVLEEKPDKNAEKVKPELHTATNDQKEEKPAGATKNATKKEETQESSKSDKSIGSASKSLSTASDVVSPLDLMGSSSPTDPKTAQMSVEEKLEAFLSAEGWSGTIKDIANKSSSDGVSYRQVKFFISKINNVTLSVVLRS